MTLVSYFFFLSPLTCYLLFVSWNWQGVKDGKGKDRYTFKLNFYFRDLRLFCAVECFPEPVEITLLLGQGVREILGIFFDKFWVIGIEYKRFAGHFSKLRIWGSAMCACGQSVCSADAATRRRRHGLLGQKASRHVCSNLQLREKGMSSQSKYVKGTEVEYLFGAKKPIFSGIHGLCVLSEPPPRGNCYFIFIFYVIVFNISNLIPTNLIL